MSRLIRVGEGLCNPTLLNYSSDSRLFLNNPSTFQRGRLPARVLQPAERIQHLKEFLQTEIGQLQRVNVEALINMYESGELGPRQLGDPPVYLVNGKRVDKNPWKDESVPPNTPKWCENMYNQMTQQSGPQANIVKST